MIYFLRDKEKVVANREKFFDKKRSNGVIKEIAVTDNTSITDNKNKVSLFVSEMNSMFSKYEINTCKRKIHFISQMYLETMRFRATTEANSHYCLNYKGACAFRGRGAKQLTHDYNHLAYYDYLNKTNYFKTYIKFRSGFDSVTQTVAKNKHSDINKELLNKITTFADKIGSNLYYALDSAGWFSTIQAPKALAAMDNGLLPGDVKIVTKIINGGANNLTERQNYTKWLVEFMKNKGCEIK